METYGRFFIFLKKSQEKRKISAMGLFSFPVYTGIQKNRKRR